MQARFLPYTTEYIAIRLVGYVALKTLVEYTCCPTTSKGVAYIWIVLLVDFSQLKLISTEGKDTNH